MTMQTPLCRFLIVPALLAGLAVMELGFVGWNRKPVKYEDRFQRLQDMYADYRKAFPDVADITPAAAKQRAAKTELVFVDVREKSEQNVSMIPGAITAARFEADFDRYRKQQIVVYCTIGSRSGIYARDLLGKHPNLKIRNLAGSILAWAHAGRPLQTPDGKPTKRVHVYGPKWNLLPEGYEAVH